jgi:hypothetical protein
MLINPGILLNDPQSLLVAAVMIVVSIVAKFIPAWGSGKLFKMQFPNIMVMFGLSIAQAASRVNARKSNRWMGYAARELKLLERSACTLHP